MARRDRILIRDGYTCRTCGRTTVDVEVDHIVPFAASLDDSDANLQTLCIPCHEAKSNAEAALRRTSP